MRPLQAELGFDDQGSTLRREKIKTVMYGRPATIQAMSKAAQHAEEARLEGVTHHGGETGLERDCYS